MHGKLNQEQFPHEPCVSGVSCGFILHAPWFLYLRLVADDQLVVQGAGHVVNGEPQPRPILDPDESRAGPGDMPVCCPLAQNNLQGVPRFQRDGPLL